MSVLAYVVEEKNAPISAAVIWLHGLGADGSDFLPVVEELSFPKTLGIRFVFPHAPLRPVTINAGRMMRAWYDLYALSGPTPENETQLRAVSEQVHMLIESQEAQGIPTHRIILAGFSQGGATALFAGLRYPKPLGGIMALSGYLPLSQKTEAEKNVVNQKTPIFIAHGDRDTILPCTAGEQSAEFLKAQGYSVSWHRYSMAHEVCRSEISDIAAWLTTMLTK